MHKNWYDRRDELQPGMVFRAYDDGVVKLLRRTPDNGTWWYAADWYGKWLEHGSIYGPRDLLERLPDNWSGEPRLPQPKTEERETLLREITQVLLDTPFSLPRKRADRLTDALLANGWAREAEAEKRGAERMQSLSIKLMERLAATACTLAHCADVDLDEVERLARFSRSVAEILRALPLSEEATNEE